MRSPIMLWMTSRSRSSMISGIFAAHGVFWGRQQKQSAGYDTYENQEIKTALKKHYGLPFCTMADPTKDFMSELYSIVPNNETWLMKTGIEYFRVFQPMAPFNVFLLRKPEEVVKSICQKRKGSDPAVAEKAVTWRFGMMRQCQARSGGVFIDTDRVIAGDFEQLRVAMDYCGVLFDEKKTLGAIKK